MDLSKVNESLENSGLHANQKKAILDLIDHKINSDMEKILAKMEAENKSLNTKMNTIIWVIGIATVILSIVLSLKK